MLRKLLSIVLYFSPILLLAQAQVSFNGATGSIPDNNTWKTFNCNVTGLNPSTMSSAYGFEKLTLSITHNNVSDLEVRLVSPDGTEVLIFANVGGTGNNFTNTGFKKNYTTPIASGTAPFTGSYKPQGDLGLFNNGQNGNGIWQLKVRDSNSSFSGTLTSWILRFGPDPAAPPIVSSSNLPIVKIFTNGTSIPDDPKVAVDFKVIDNGPGQRNYFTDSVYAYEGVIGIEQRGSSSGGAPKKSYGFETWDAGFNEIDTSIFGFPPQSDWILTANYYDKTLMRNVLSYKLFNDMGHYASRTRYCELYIDNEYQGVYVAMEKIKRDNNRVDVARLTAADTAGNEVTGGYIWKIDKFTGSGGDGFYSNYPPSNPTGDAIFYQYEYPDQTSILPQQKQYLQRYVDSFETALFGPNFADPANGFRRYAGERTFIDYMFINEISKNVDGYRLSTYFYKDKHSNGGKLKAGPVWDYDITYMNADYCEAQIDTGWAYNLNYVCPGAAVPAHWERMLQDTLFRARVKCRWNQLRKTILHLDTLYAFIDSTASLLNEAQQRNFTLWPILGVPTWPEPQPLPQTYAEQILRLKTWLSSRLAWMDAQINNYPTITLPVTLGADTTICAGSIVTLNPGKYKTYVWNNGLTVPALNVGNSGTYAVTVSDDFGCEGSAAVTLAVNTPVVNTGNDTTVCEGEAVVLEGGSFAAYVWNNGANTPAITTYQSGSYAVTVTDALGCTATDNTTIAHYNYPHAQLGSDTAFCAGESLTLQPGIFSEYVWNTGATTPTLSVNTTGTYTVSVKDAAGCNSSDTVNITVHPAPNAGFTLANTPGTYSFTFSASGNGLTYWWTFGDGATSTLPSPTHVYSTNGMYVVQLTVTNPQGCTTTATDTLYIQVSGTSNLANATLRLYPNPAYDVLHLVYDGTVPISNITITDLAGKLCSRVSPTGGDVQSIDISQLSPGSYIIMITATERFFIKFIKQ